MPAPSRNRWTGCAVATALFLASFLVRFELSTWLTDRAFVIFIPAIVLTALFAGTGLAIIGAVLTGIAIEYFFYPPFDSFRIQPDAAVGLGAYGIVAVTCILLVHWLRAINTKLEEERTRAQALARERELLIEADPNGLLVSDPAGKIQMVNSRLETLFGYNRNELIGQPIEILLPVRFRDHHGSLRAGFFAHPSNRAMGAGRDLYALRKDGSEFPVEIGLSAFAIGGNIAALAVVIDITERKQAAERERLLVRELQHRSNNLFAIIDTLATRTLSGSFSLDEAREAFVGRLHTLARANQQLANRAWRGASLNDIIQSELEPFAGRFKIDGETDVTLTPQAAQNFALAVHELATNAAKYGALSVPQGKVTIGWTIGAKKLKFRWQEREGPPVALPRRKGFGTTLLSATLGDGLTQFPAEGFSYEVDVALSAIFAPTAPDANSASIQTAASQH